ncbi:MAG: patatin-like phospholipase family protein [Candidatus Gracilibacteria bacterium]|nr:patatin-like phospholipase family protein [bacterium]MDZ4217044.1 patatin-like phospholipase family protein [Candidatus Gracilibacteria bacterium]
MAKTYPKIGLALGGGGVRGYFHIGFYEVLCEHNVPLSFVTGTSMGAVIGAAIGLGYSAQKIRDFVSKYKDLDLFSLTNFNYFNEGLISAESFKKHLYPFYENKTFEDLKIPFVCAAVDLESGEKVVMKSGLIAEAVQASSSLPLVFPPMFLNDRYLVDGGVLDEVPAVLCRELGAEKLIAIRLQNNVVRQHISGLIYAKHYDPVVKPTLGGEILGFFSRKREDIRLLIEIILQSLKISIDANTQNNLDEAKPDLLVEPIVDVSLLDFSQTDEAIEAGRKSALGLIAQIESWAE